eukprot:TRINITY_DN15712_c0_g1_i1.p1 TRINITY_DN15712_c0_g1~~TRINITY_DN15712_c0_g1_i1.p1  ORF type:complete len:132 (-),score=24.13 TRINITY_DN15712_c0_g1_i1:72-467(-)
MLEIFENYEEFNLVQGCAYDYLPSNPGLYIKEIGKINLPINKKTFDEIKVKCTKNQLDGPNSSWELDPEFITFQNDRWGIGLPQLIEKIAEEIVTAKKRNIKAKLIKLLLLEKGQFMMHRKDESSNIFALN